MSRGLTLLRAAEAGRVAWAGNQGVTPGDRGHVGSTRLRAIPDDLVGHPSSPPSLNTKAALRRCGVLPVHSFLLVDSAGIEPASGACRAEALRACPVTYGRTYYPK